MFAGGVEAEGREGAIGDYGGDFCARPEGVAGYMEMASVQVTLEGSGEVGFAVIGGGCAKAAVASAQQSPRSRYVQPML